MTSLEILRFKNSIVEYINSFAFPMEVKRMCVSEIATELKTAAEAQVRMELETERQEQEKASAEKKKEGEPDAESVQSD